MDGGYYRYDFENRSVSLLAMNSVIYMSKNKEETSSQQNQIDWLIQNF
jgi:Tfp pilus assembly protein PilV